MPQPHLRAADTDRAAVADVLGRHMSAGRLTLDEFDERLTRAYAAKTFGELAELTADLPPLDGVRPRATEGSPGQASTAPTSGGGIGPWGHGPATPAPWGQAPVSQTPGPHAPGAHSPGAAAAWGHGAGGHGSWGNGQDLRSAWRAWLSTALIVLTIWAVTSLASWEFHYFWPVWVIGPWGGVLLARTLTADRDDSSHRPGLPGS